MENQRGGKRASTSAKPPRNLPREKVFGASALQLSDHEAFRLVGSIVEKGVFNDQPLATSSSTPRPSALPFPVARHRSHGPHWGPKGEDSYEDDEGDNDDESDAMNYDPISRFANPLERKNKKGLDLRNWRELLSSDSSDAHRKEKGSTENMEVSYGESTTDNLPISREINVKLQSNKGKRRFPSDTDGEFAEPVDSMELDRFAEPSSMTSSIEDGVTLRNGKAYHASVSMDYEVANDVKSKTLSFDGAKGRGRFTFGQETLVYERESSLLKESSTSRGVDVAPKSEYFSLESQIDAENQARLQSMSPDEIAEAQAEIRDKINPKLLNLLKKRGIEKHSSTKIVSASSDGTGLPGKKHIENSTVLDRNVSPSGLSAAHQDTQRTPGVNATPAVSPDVGGLWDAWSKRVEAARNLRFSLDGNVMQMDSLHSTNFAGENDLSNGGYSADNVAERDLLRTEGDPAAAGYTIKEALALSRSVIPGQRALALHLLSAVLNNALQNFHQDNMKHFVDWEAVWAFALGPEAELALSLRLSLDDNHDSVVLACAKSIQCILAYDWNEQFFDISDKLASQEKHLYTAPVFRSKPDIQGGFLHGGFWKYSAKPSNILDGNIAEGKDEEERTIQDDNVIAGQDIVAGLVRMGILPRLRFLLETNPTVGLEECILSILIAIARHSPTCADAILKCEGLVQTVQDRFMLKNKWEVHPCKVKSVKLVRVLAQSDNRNCSEFVKNGTFERMMWKLYQGPVSLNDWVALGKEHCKVLSQLMVEELRFWKVCIKYGHCVSYFTYFYPALCLWLNPPTIDRVIEKDVLQQYSSVAGEAYLVLGALAEKLPNWHTRDSLSRLSSDTCNDDTAIWCWSDAASVVDIALQWMVLDSGAPLYKLLDKQNEGWAKSLLWVISAVLHMLSTIVKKATPAYSLNPKTAERGPLLLDLVSKIGLPLINNGFLSFTGSDILDHSSETNAGGSFTEKLCQFRHHTDHVASLASTCCLHGLLRLVASIDELIDLAKNQVLAVSFKEKELSKEDRILDAGILKCSVVEWKRGLCECVKSFKSVNHTVHNIEVFGRGGPAPGVGIGWGVAGGGFWSLAVVLVQEDARLLVDLLQVFQASSPKYVPGSEDKAITGQTINSTLAILLSVGPRDKMVAEKALKTLLQIPVLKHLNLSLFNFLHNGQGGQLPSWEYKEDDLEHFSNILTSHFRNRWLCKKGKKSKAQDGIGSPQHKPYQNRSLATIHEDIDTSATLLEDSASLAVEWAKQRLPLPSHWLLSPIATIGDISRTSNGIQDPVELLDVAKAGLFFLLGVEALFFSLSEGDCSPIRSVPLVWKLHSLSVSLFSGMGVLEEESGRDIFEALQRLYGQHLDELRLSIKGSNINLLNFQSDIHENYSTFIETLVEQFAAISYGDLAYGRQISVYLHCGVDARTRLSAWNALSNAHVLELLPSLDNFITMPEGYLKPLEEDESLLEAFLKSWVNGALDRAATRCSGTYTIALHYLSSFVFSHDVGEKLSLRNRFVKSLLRHYSRKQQHEVMMLDLMKYNYQPNTEMFEDLSLQSILARRFQILMEACEGNSSLVSMVERLKSASSRLA